MSIIRTHHRTLVLLGLFLGVSTWNGGDSAAGREIINQQYPTGPYLVSNAVGPTISDGSASPAKYSIQGHVKSSTDAPGFSYFSGMAVNATFTASVAVDYHALAQTATSTATAQYCPFLSPSSSPCNCGCYEPPGSALAQYSTPGTSPTLCAPGSYALTQPLTPEGCSDTSAQEVVYQWVANPATPEGFSLAFGDGTTVGQIASSPLFFALNSTTPTVVTLQGGQSALDGWPFSPPAGGLTCAAGTAQNSSFCSGVYEVQWLFTGGSIAQSDLTVSEIDINYYGDSSGYTPDGQLRLAVDYQWQPGAADPGGPMVFESAWSPTFEYKVNNVVTFSGVTYLATNGNVEAEPDLNANQWVAIGSAAGGSGQAGPAGPAGPAGSQGAAGAAGAAGATGPTGATGVAGPTGATGVAGPQGPSGPVGSVGAQGPAGAPGAAGAQGATGATGPQGFAGSAGAQGPVGPIGPAGAEGPAGATGAQGPTGLLDAATLSQIEGEISALNTLTAQQGTTISTLTSQVTTLRSDLLVVGTAGFAGLAQPGVADNFVATMESMGQDPVTALHSVSVDLGIAIDSTENSQVSSDLAIYGQIVQQLQAELAVATSALNKAEAQNNHGLINYWQAVVAAINQQLASVQGGNF